MERRDRDLDELCAQEQVLKGRHAAIARQIGDNEMRRLQIDGVTYQEYKLYRGCLCIGTRYRVA